MVERQREVSKSGKEQRRVRIADGPLLICFVVHVHQERSHAQPYMHCTANRAEPTWPFSAVQQHIPQFPLRLWIFSHLRCKVRSITRSQRAHGHLLINRVQGGARKSSMQKCFNMAKQELRNDVVRGNKTKVERRAKWEQWVGKRKATNQVQREALGTEGQDRVGHPGCVASAAYAAV